MKLDAIWRPESQQQIFRQLMDAMARPGRVKEISQWLNGTEGFRAVLATLLDAEVSLADHYGLLEASDWPLLQARRAPAEQADYLLCDGQRAPDFEPHLGTLECPDQSTTIVIVVSDQWSVAGSERDPAAANGDCVSMILTGPGIEGSETLLTEGLAPEWMEKRLEWTAAFPLGVDLILAAPGKVSCIPRTTCVE